MALPDKHQLKFNIHKDAKSLMEAIKKRFGENKETKKVQKTPLKQRYESFTGSTSKRLDQIHDRLQKLISQLEILGRSGRPVEILKLKERVKVLEDREGIAATRSGDDTPIKGRSMDEGEAATERISDDTEEMATILTSIDAATGKEVMVESDTPKKQILQGHIDAQVARELEEQLEREDKRMSEQIARDAESQQRKSWTKKQKRDYYMAVIRNNLGWKVKDFKGMTFEKVEAKFNSVYKQMEDFIPMGSKEEGERYKRKGIRFDQESSKKLKSSKEVIEEAKSTDEIPEENIKEMMQLIPIEEVYVEALQVKHPIIDWK
nr:hypothetical protein [Tanacetum cinerariifolium]